MAATVAGPREPSGAQAGDRRAAGQGVNKWVVSSAMTPS